MLHGGEIYQGMPVKYDFSVNVNPMGIPEPVLSALRESLPLLTRYPDRDCTRLRAAVSGAASIPAERILCGNGASELIEAAVRALRPHTVLLTAPSFSGYRRAAAGAGACVRYHRLRRDEGFSLTARYLDDLASRPGLAVLCSPANPVGNLIDPALLARIVERCESQGTWLLADECFLGFVQGEEGRTLRRFFRTSYRGAVPKRLLVLDSFTKRFAVPGLRLGILLAADPAVLARIRAQQPEWSVSLPAQAAGVAAVEAAADGRYMKETKALVRAERARMEAALRALGFTVYPGEANYILFSTGDPRAGRGPVPPDLTGALRQRGILIRHCANYPGLGESDYRAAVLRPEENSVLLSALEEICAPGISGKERCGEGEGDARTGIHRPRIPGRDLPQGGTQ